MKTITYLQTPIFFSQSLNIATNSAYSKTIYLIDENVFKHWKHLFENYTYIIVPSGEENKQLSFVENIIEQLIELEVDRKSFLIGVGGGVVCDITGFVASIYQRGIDFAFVPTTLLAQVDASIGGKNGVNTKKYKNMIGVFKQPGCILINTDFLTTLPDDEFISGLAEIVKHACIRDENYFNYIKNNVENILKKDSETIQNLIFKSVEIKTQIVEKDPYEQNERKILNYGHTFGHAIEKLYNVKHGYAVALGMIMVNKMAMTLNMLKKDEACEIKHLLKQLHLPVNIEDLDFEKIINIATRDKKRKSSTIDFILLRKIGHAEIVPIKIEEITSILSKS